MNYGMAWARGWREYNVGMFARDNPYKQRPYRAAWASGWLAASKVQR